MKIKVLELKDEMDSAGDVMSINAIVKFFYHIPLVLNYSMDEIIGHGYLFKEGNTFFIKEIKPSCLIKSSGELLNNKEFINLLRERYPCVGGTTYKRTGPVIEDFSIKYISFESSKNCDYSIKTIGEQLNETNNL